MTAPRDPACFHADAPAWRAALLAPWATLAPAAQAAVLALITPLGEAFATTRHLHYDDDALAVLPLEATHYAETVLAYGVTAGWLTPADCAQWTAALPVKRAAWHADPRGAAFAAPWVARQAQVRAQGAEAPARLAQWSGVPRAAIRVLAAGPGSRTIYAVGERVCLPMAIAATHALVEATIAAFPVRAAVGDPVLLADALGWPRDVAPWLQLLDRVPDDASTAWLQQVAGMPLGTLAARVAPQVRDLAPYLLGDLPVETVCHTLDDWYCLEVLDLTPATFLALTGAPV